jgi:gliding motility-associated protein GldC
MKTSEFEIKLKIKLDENRIPEKISWESSEKEDPPRDISSMLLSVWDKQEKNTHAIPLWTKDMIIEDLKLHVFQTIMTMGETYNQATKDTELYNYIKDLGFAFGEKAGIVKPKEVK